MQPKNSSYKHLDEETAKSYLAEVFCTGKDADVEPAHNQQIFVRVLAAIGFLLLEAIRNRKA